MLCAALLGWCADGSAQDSGAQPASLATVSDASASSQSETDAACVLHVWPGKGFHTVYFGWIHGGTVDGAQKGRKGYPEVPEEPLSVPVQLSELGKLDLPATLGLTGYQTILHNAPLDATALRSNPERQVPGTGACYAELMIDNMVFQNNAINGKWLNIIFRFRQFEGSAKAPTKTYVTYVLSRTTLFPPAPDTDPQPALDELHAAFSHAVTEFGVQYAAYLKRNGKKKSASITL